MKSKGILKSKKESLKVLVKTICEILDKGKERVKDAGITFGPTSKKKVVYTSCFDKLDRLLEEGFTDIISVAGKAPEWFTFYMDCDSRLKKYPALAPKKEIWDDWSAGIISNQMYRSMYELDVLDELDLEDFKKHIGEKTVLLCYEKSGEFCHRQFISDFLNKHGIKCEEYKENK